MARPAGAAAQLEAFEAGQLQVRSNTVNISSNAIAKLRSSIAEFDALIAADESSSASVSPTVRHTLLRPSYASVSLGAGSRFRLFRGLACMAVARPGFPARAAAFPTRAAAVLCSERARFPVLGMDALRIIPAGCCYSWVLCRFRALRARYLVRLSLFDSVRGVAAHEACGVVEDRHHEGGSTRRRFIFQAGMVRLDDGSAAFARDWDHDCQPVGAASATATPEPRRHRHRAG